MPLNTAGHYWKSVIPTHKNKVFYEIPIECNGEGENIPEQNDYIEKRRSSNVENMDINALSQFSSSTSVMSSQKEPLFKKNQSRVSHVNGGDPCNQTSGFESLLSPTSIPTHTQSLSPKKKARVRTFLPRATQSKKKFIKLQDKVKENHKNISNAKKQRAHMNPVRNAQSPDHTSTKSKDLKQPTFLNGSSNKIQQCEVPKARLKKPSVKIQQLTESKSPKRMPKTRSNAISVGHRSTENAKSIVSSSVQNDSCTIKMKPMNKLNSKKEIGSKKKLKEVAKPRSLKKNEVSEQKRTPKKYKRINTVESSDESDMEISIKNKLKPKKLKPIDSETESDEVNTQTCIKENNPVVHEVEPVLPAVITLSIEETTNMFSSLKELDSSESISSNEDSEKKSHPVPNDDSEKISHPVPNEDSERISHPVPNEDSERISHPVPNEDSEKISHPVPSEIESVIIVNEVPSKEKSACNPMKQTKNPYKNLVQVPFQDNQPAFFTNILQQVKGMNEITNFSIPSTSRVVASVRSMPSARIESNEVVDLDPPPVDEIIIDLVSSDEHEEEEDDDVEFIEVTKAKG